MENFDILSANWLRLAESVQQISSVAFMETVRFVFFVFVFFTSVCVVLSSSPASGIDDSTFYVDGV
jgi:hypothetical protein